MSNATAKKPVNIAAHNPNNSIVIMFITKSQISFHKLINHNLVKLTIAINGVKCIRSYGTRGKKRPGALEGRSAAVEKVEWRTVKSWQNASFKGICYANKYDNYLLIWENH
jgi:hypothetical protein